ncbi:hypothetical protein DTO212C5_2355 [Paecilomyces variotii]|nr:hypothetical protein DTO212C5_2355 [Paecilomyces variotii]
MGGFQIDHLCNRMIGYISSELHEIHTINTIERLRTCGDQFNNGSLGFGDAAPPTPGESSAWHASTPLHSTAPFSSYLSGERDRFQRPIDSRYREAGKVFQ